MNPITERIQELASNYDGAARPEDFIEIYDGLYPLAFSMCSQRINSLPDPLCSYLCPVDLTHDCLSDAIREALRYWRPGGGARFSSYCLNSCFMRTQLGKRIRRESGRSTSWAVLSNNLASDCLTYESQGLSWGDRDSLYSALSVLDDEERDLVTLHFLYGKSLRTISKERKLCTQVASRRIKEALAKMRQYL